MSKIVEFVVILDEGVRKRHRHETIAGKVAIRYDCAHGYAHLDRYDIVGKRTKEALNLHFESALTYGDWDINENWQQYQIAFLKGSKYERLQ
jgi:hypothetical protein